MTSVFPVDAAAGRPVTKARNGTESPSRKLELVPPRLPFSHALSMHWTGAANVPLRHWSIVAAGPAARASPGNAKTAVRASASSTTLDDQDICFLRLQPALTGAVVLFVPVM